MVNIKLTLLVLICGLLSIKVKALDIAVIGAGASGLAAAKNAIDQHHKVIVFEKSNDIGGVWLYTDKIGKEIHSPMYEELKTNVHHKMMTFKDFLYPKDTPPYPSHKQVLNYMKSYVEKFNLMEYIKLDHVVDKVVRVEDKDNKENEGKWRITARNLKEKKSGITMEFDAVFVCSGVTSSPRIPDIEGAKKFRGRIMHSHDYRKPEVFKEEKHVLVIGKGPSGNDIVIQLTKQGIKVTHSSYTPITKDSSSKNMMEKAREMLCFNTKDEGTQEKPSSSDGNVKRFTTNGVEFQNKIREKFSLVIYATGYIYSYPFLDKSAGMKITDDHVSPLYKQILNINHPTMAFIGVPYDTVHNPMYGLQARFALKYISKEKALPTKEVMLEDANKIANEDKPHRLGLKQYRSYFADLSKTADIENIE